MTKSTFALLIVIVSLMELVRSDCCGTTIIAYRVTDTSQYSCFDVPGGSIAKTPGTSGRGGTRLADTTSNAYYGRCEVTVCGDGNFVSGTYCGVGSCNVAGCNCAGGCIPGNAIQNFLQQHGHMIKEYYQRPTYVQGAKFIANKVFGIDF